MNRSKAEIHNRVVREFIGGNLSRLLKEHPETTNVDLLCIMESLVLGIVLFNEQAFGTPRRVSAEQLEVLTMRVMERMGRS